MTDDGRELDRRPGSARSEYSREYLTRLLAELREKVRSLEQQKVQTVQADVTDTNAGESTFTVTVPVQEDGGTSPLAGISAPPQFMPSVGDVVTLQMIGPVPTFMPDSIASDAVTDREIAPGTKVHVWRQPNQPTAVDVGDVWIDTDDGNKQYIWGPVGTIIRQNLALNPSFEADAVGVVASAASWTNYTSGTPGSLTVSITSTAAVVADQSRAARVVSDSMPATNGTAMGWSQSFTATTGDIFRISAVVTVQVTDQDKVPELLIEWLNGVTVVGSASVTGDGTTTARQTLAYTSSTMPAGVTSVRLTIRRRANGNGVALANADLAADAVLVEKNPPPSSQGNYFDGASPSGSDSKWDTPSAAPNSTSTYWQNSVPGTNQWYPVLIRNGGVEPGSLVASNIIASETVTASLLEALMVLTNIVIAGDPASDHATLQSDGVHLFRNTMREGLLEVGRLATGTGNFLSLVDGGGDMVANIDDSGGASFVNLNVANDPVFQGHTLSGTLTGIPGGGGAGTSKPGARNWVGWDATAVITGVTAEVGLVEMAITPETDRIYLLIPSFWFVRDANTTYVDVKIRDGGAGVPTTSSPIIDQAFFSGGDNQAWTMLCERIRAQRFVTGGTHRLLLTAAAGGGGIINVVNPVNTNSPMLSVIDMGPDWGNPASTNRGAGGTPAPLQQYYVELTPTATSTFRGDGTLRTDTTDIVQGWDQSGTNGDGSGWWTFTLPTITGTVNRIDWYVYCNYTYFGSGGRALWQPIHSGPPSWPMSSLRNAVEWDPGVTYPNPGPVTVTLPSSWYSGFASSASPQSIGIAAGPAAGIGQTTNETYYCRFDGPSARLRIWYTQ